MERTGYILRQMLDEELRKVTEAAARRIIPPGENQGYELGKALGYTDGLKMARALLKELPDEPRPEKRIIWGRDTPF